MSSPEVTTPPATAPQGNPARKKALTAVAAAVVVAGIAYGAYWALVLNHYESTDNAYVQGNLVQLTPQVGGTVVAINADDTDHVKAGQLLVRLDPADAQVALEQAEQANALAAAESAYDLATQRYKAGLGTYLTVLNAESSVLTQRRLAADLKARALDSQVALIRALGGGYRGADPARAGD